MEWGEDGGSCADGDVGVAFCEGHPGVEAFAGGELVVPDDCFDTVIFEPCSEASDGLRGECDFGY